MSQLQTVPIEEKLKPMELDPLPAQPLVSVIVPNYNYARFIGEAIESVLNQTYQSFEIVICDDGSKDNSCEVVESYARRDSRVRLIRKENGGMASALNLAYAGSSGQVICLLDADDIFEPKKIERVVASFIENPQAGFCIHRLQPVSTAGKNLSLLVPVQLERGWIANRVLRVGGGTDRAPYCSGFSFRREVTDEIFPLPSHLKTFCDEYLKRVAIFLSEICSVDEPLGKYRLHGQNTTGMSSVSESRILKCLHDWQAAIDAQKEFLARRRGMEIAECIRMEDVTTYWEYLLALYLLRPSRSGLVSGYTLEDILAHLPERPKKHLWRLLLSMPRRVGKRCLELWWTPGWWKRYMEFAVRSLRLRSW